MGSASVEWTTRYEMIRQRVLEQSHPGETGALLVRCGVAIWMRVEPMEASTPAPETMLPPLQADPTPALPADLSQEITRLFVNLFLDQAKEATP